MSLSHQCLLNPSASGHPPAPWTVSRAHLAGLRASAFRTFRITQAFPCGRVAATGPNSDCHCSQGLRHQSILVCVDSKKGGRSGGTPLLGHIWAHCHCLHTHLPGHVFTYCNLSVCQAPVHRSQRPSLLSTALDGLSCLRQPTAQS